MGKKETTLRRCTEKTPKNQRTQEERGKKKYKKKKQSGGEYTRHGWKSDDDTTRKKTRSLERSPDRLAVVEGREGTHGRPERTQ